MSVWAVSRQAPQPVPTPQEAAENQASLNRFAANRAHYPPRFRQDAPTFDEEWTRLGGRLYWGPARLLVDAVPQKNGREQPHSELDRTGLTLLRLTANATREVQVISAYLFRLDRGFEALR